MTGHAPARTGRGIIDAGVGTTRTQEEAGDGFDAWLDTIGRNGSGAARGHTGHTGREEACRRRATLRRFDDVLCAVEFRSTERWASCLQISQ